MLNETADITTIYTQDILQGTLELLDATNLKTLVRPGMKVSIKPNLVLAKPPELGATTHSEVVEGVIQYLRDLGISDIKIIESAWIGDDTKRVFKVCGYDAICKKYGIPFYDLKDDKIRKIDTGKYTFEVCSKAVETDFLINIPVLKAHCQTQLTCNLKNLKGCIPDSEKRRFHALGLHSPIAYLNKAIKTHFCVVDGICGDLDFEEGGNPVQRNMLLAGSDPLLLDSYCAELIGYRADEIDYLRIASQIGVGQLYGDTTTVTELNADKKPPCTKADSGMVKRLAAHINDDKACSACYAALIYALHHANVPKAKINIGQGFIGKPGAIGCGDCTSGHERYVPGCPPTAADVLELLRKVVDNSGM
jgi:uncharacterized protein (DUF362 family)